MTTSQTFAWWSTCAICVTCVDAKRSYCPSSSRARSHYHSHAFHSHTLSLPHISTSFRDRHATKNVSRSGGNHVDQHDVVNKRLALFSERQKIKAIPGSYCYYFTLQESSRKYKTLTITKRARRRQRQQVLQDRMIYLFIY